MAKTKGYNTDIPTNIMISNQFKTPFGVFDLSKSPLTVELPKTNGRYMSLLLISQNHDIYPAYYAPGKWTFSEKEIGTRYIMFVIRTFADPNNPKDMEKAHKIQDAVKVIQKDKGSLSGIHQWNEKEMLMLRKAYNTIGSTTSSSAPYFGVKCDRSYLMNAMGVAVGWGGLQAKDAIYIPVQVEKNDGKTPYILNVPKEVPVDGFWSVSVYNKDRFFEKNKYNIYSLNNITAKKNKDGSVTIHFGGNPDESNFIPIMLGWVYIVRLYQPHKEILDGIWKFSSAKMK